MSLGGCATHRVRLSRVSQRIASFNGEALDSLIERTRIVTVAILSFAKIQGHIKLRTSIICGERDDVKRTLHELYFNVPRRVRNVWTDGM